MKRTIITLAIMALTVPALADECGPATFTNDTGATLEVGVQLGEGYVETSVPAGDTITYWEAAPGRGWAVWDLASGDVLASGVQCGEPVVIEDPVVDADPVDIGVDDTDMVVEIDTDRPASDIPADDIAPIVTSPYRPAGVRIQ